MGLLPTARVDRRTVLLPVRFFGDFCWSGRSSAFNYLQSGDVSHYAVSQTLRFRINQIGENGLVGLVIGCELVRIACNQLSGNLLDGGYPNLTHSNTPEARRAVRWPFKYLASKTPPSSEIRFLSKYFRFATEQKQICLILRINRSLF